MAGTQGGQTQGSGKVPLLSRVEMVHYPAVGGTVGGDGEGCQWHMLARDRCFLRAVTYRAHCALEHMTLGDLREYRDSHHLDSHHLDSHHLDSHHLDSHHLDSHHLDSVPPVALNQRVTAMLALSCEMGVPPMSLEGEGVPPMVAGVMRLVAAATRKAKTFPRACT
ncbi:hypothetical protein CLOM_g20420 [Closterium sp. NIES-68]|nr:hypothetical protein CLOM_g20420 [Closterium sp. NIES-68]GJP71341.1 hypothetical protein CLOP_g2181 [Closterium sp. NIES-67]GJP79468.1 hypothetical protein CLOP_g9700 [Closterium sp. NIES-67]